MNKSNLIAVANENVEPQLQMLVVTPEMRVLAQRLAQANVDLIVACDDGSDLFRNTVMTTIAFLSGIAGNP